MFTVLTFLLQVINKRLTYEILSQVLPFFFLKQNTEKLKMFTIQMCVYPLTNEDNVLVCWCFSVNIELDRTDLLIYEEVARMPPFQRKTLVLLGAKNVGRRTLKERLTKADPTRFAGVVPCTSLTLDI